MPINLFYNISLLTVLARQIESFTSLGVHPVRKSITSNYLLLFLWLPVLIQLTRESLAFCQPENPRPTRLQPLDLYSSISSYPFATRFTPRRPPQWFVHPSKSSHTVPSKKKNPQKEKPLKKTLSNASFQSKTKKRKKKKSLTYTLLVTSHPDPAYLQM
jgi:hypothetical protein